MHHKSASTNYAWLPHNVDPAHHKTPAAYRNMPVQPLGNRQAEFEEYIEGCVAFYDTNGKRCKTGEKDRIDMTLRQPKGVYNYTQTGYTKIRAPKAVFELLKAFWEKNKHREREEAWGVGNIYVNHWEGPTYMVSVEDGSLEGGGYVLKQHIWNVSTLRSCVNEPWVHSC